jgi:hypothetical protein
MRFYVNDWADLNAAIVRDEAAGSIGNPILMRGLRDGKHAYVPVASETSTTFVKKFIAATHDRPTIMLIGDDDGLDLGPKGFRSARRILSWGRWVLLHAAAAQPEHYHLAMAMAQLCQRVVVIETSTNCCAQWQALIRSIKPQPATVVVWPRDNQHPTPMRPGDLQ